MNGYVRMHTAFTTTPIASPQSPLHFRLFFIIIFISACANNYRNMRENERAGVSACVCLWKLCKNAKRITICMKGREAGQRERHVNDDIRVAYSGNGRRQICLLDGSGWNWKVRWWCRKRKLTLFLSIGQRTKQLKKRSVFFLLRVMSS